MFILAAYLVQFKIGFFKKKWSSYYIRGQLSSFDSESESELGPFWDIEILKTFIEQMPDFLFDIGHSSHRLEQFALRFNFNSITQSHV